MRTSVEVNAVKDIWKGRRDSYRFGDSVKKFYAGNA
jgi:hypothetical protein